MNIFNFYWLKLKSLFIKPSLKKVILEYALELYKVNIERKGYCGLCNCVKRAIQLLNVDVDYRLILSLPDSKLSYGKYWWHLCDTQSRIKYLKKLISKCE